MAGNRRALILLPIFLLVLVSATVYRLFLADRPADQLVELTGPTMGTTYTVKIRPAEPLTQEQHAVVVGAIGSRLDLVNGLMSTWDPQSEVSRFNQHTDREPFPLSRETAEVVRIALSVSDKSRGAFDITVGKLVQIWGFGSSDRLPEPPDSKLLNRYRIAVGYRLLSLAADGSSLSKSIPATHLDFSAIAKGYGVDQVAIALAELGYDHFLVEIGGELRTAGRPAPDRDWRLAIERPDPDRRVIHALVPLSDKAMATSGDYRNFYENEGVWLSHLLDPRTGHPIDHDLASVTVVHDRCVWADAWATALIVLGPEDGYATALREGLAAYFIVREEDGGFTVKMTPAFKELQPAEVEGRNAGI